MWGEEDAVGSRAHAAVRSEDAAVSVEITAGDPEDDAARVE